MVGVGFVGGEATSQRQRGKGEGEELLEGDQGRGTIFGM